MKIYHSILAIIPLALTISSCKDSADGGTTTAESSLLDALYKETAPAGALHISEVFKQPTPGKAVVVHGEIMGRLKPFVEGRAMVMLGDPTKVTPCNRIPGDSCPTPWDTCCDDPEVLKKSITTIQFVDEEGRVLKEDLKGYKGIKELSFLTVKGTIAEGSNAENLLINAEAFHLTDPSPFKDAPPASDYSHHGHVEGGTITEEDGVFIFTKDPEPAKADDKKDGE